MKKEDLQDYLDELYLLEQKSAERLQKLVAHSDQRLSSLKQQEENLKDLMSKQLGSVIRLERGLADTQTLHEKIVKWGRVLGGLLVVGFVILFLWWWHIDSLMNDEEELKTYVVYQARHLPELVKKSDGTYIRVVSEEGFMGMTDDQGRLLNGSYARVYLPADQQK